MSKGVFITGTDTGIGKTWFTLALMGELKKQGQKVSGMKPIASGALLTEGKLENEDACQIMEHCSAPTEYELINPFVFELPVSPHIAADQAGKKIKFQEITSCYKKLASQCDNIIVEGVGGWRVPISEDKSIVDLVRVLELPVILVVGLKLGCINHAILTAEAIKADGIKLVGWASNRVDNGYLCPKETIATLQNALSCPLIADMPFMERYDQDKFSGKIDLNAFL